MGVSLKFIQPRKPTQNGFVERFNGSFRYEVLDAFSFDSLADVQQESERWLDDYNCIRPHESLGDISPIAFLHLRGHGQISTYGW